MSNVNTNCKMGHPVAGIVLGIAGIAVSLLLTLMFGVIAGAVAAGLGIFAAVLGISARRHGRRGMGAIVAGVMAVILAVTMTFSTVTILTGMKQTAQAAGIAPTFAKCMDNPYMGVAGIAANAMKVQNETDAVKTIQGEMEALRVYMDKNGTTVSSSVSVQTSSVVEVNGVVRRSIQES